MVALLSDALWGTYRVPLGTSEALWRTYKALLRENTWGTIKGPLMHH